MSDLGTLGGSQSRAWAVNDSGQVVGYSYLIRNTTYHAFLYEGNSMVDLNTLLSPGSGWVLNYATGINDSGQVAGYGSINGNTHAFLLTPIPEPGTMVLLGLGGAMIAARRRRNR